jgi:hypothetical protein
MRTAIAICLVLSLQTQAQQAPESKTPAPATTQHATMIDPLSVQSLLLAVFSQGQVLGTATGFVIEKHGKYYLVTNWHVVADRRPDTDAPMDPQGRYPDEIRILHNEKGHLGTWVWRSEKLVNEKNEYLWIEHPKGRAVDIVFLPLSNLDDVQIYPANLELRNSPISIVPTAEVSIIGFPFGKTETAGLPIWKSGTVASDPDIDYDQSPQFLVDCTGRPGMSGSPVYARRIGSYPTEGGGLTISTGTTDKFLGIYAGSIDDRSEIGRVWKASAIMTIYDALP